MRLDRCRRSARRAGFTLVEVLVAAGLAVLIMTVMATCFQAGMDTLSQLKSLGDLQQQLRTADTLLRRDLQMQHLESPFGNRVSDQRLDLYRPYNPYLLNANGTALIGTNPSSFGDPPLWQPPTAGFFRIFQGQDPVAVPLPARGTGVSVFEGADTDTGPSTRATTHILHMAVKVPADRLDRVFTTPVPTGPGNAIWNLLSPLATARTLPQAAPQPGTEFGFPSEWAEVAYFLDDPVTGIAPGTSEALSAGAPRSPATPGTGATNQPTGLRLFTLYRKVRVLGSGNPQAADFLRTTMAAALAAPGPVPANIAATPNLWKYQGLSFNPTTYTTMNHVTVGPDFLNSPRTIAGPYQRLGGVRSARNSNPTSDPLVPADVLLPTSPLQPPIAPTAGAGQQLDRIGYERDLPNANPTATEAVLTNVISFEVRATWDVNPNADYRYAQAMVGSAAPPSPTAPFPADRARVPLTALLPGWSGRADGPFDDLPPIPEGVTPGGTPVGGNPLFERSPTAASLDRTRPRVFDTWAGNNLLPMGRTLPPGNNPTQQFRVDWDRPLADLAPLGTPPSTPANPGAAVQPQPNPNCVPLFIRVKAVQIKIRVWDPKNKVARQITLIEPV